MTNYQRILIVLSILAISTVLALIDTQKVSINYNQSLAAAPAAEPLVQLSNFVYQGSFRLPACWPLSACGGAAFGYAGLGMGYNQVNDSLYLNGYDGSGYEGYVAEVKVPTTGISPSNTTLASLPRANFIQQFSDAFEGHMKDVEADKGGLVKVGGILPYNGKLYISDYVYYDSTGLQQNSHFVRPLNLSTTGQVQGPFASNTGLGAGFTSGYFALVPPEWQSLLGGPVLNGNCCLSIITRTSFGPAAFAINPAQIGTVTPFPAQPLVYYPENHPTLGPWGGNNPNYGGATQVKGMVFPTGTRSVLFFGQQGMGSFCYGEGTSDTSLVGTGPADDPYCYDPSNSAHGGHAYPYAYYMWGYDANDLAAVKSGTKQPWDVAPYGVWQFNPGFPSWSNIINGAAYDPATGRIFLTVSFADSDAPVIEVYTLNTTTPTDTQPPTTPTNLSATATSTTQINLTWTASTDDVGVTGYKIFRNGTQVGTSTGPTYSDSGLTPSTNYSYTVSAYDASAKNSAISSPATARTFDPPPAPIAGDLNQDHIVNSLDWSFMNSKWFTSNTNADLNHDGIVNAIDFSILNSNWFKTW